MVQRAHTSTALQLCPLPQFSVIAVSQQSNKRGKQTKPICICESPRRVHRKTFTNDSKIFCMYLLAVENRSMWSRLSVLTSWLLLADVAVVLSTSSAGRTTSSGSANRTLVGRPPCMWTISWLRSSRKWAYLPAWLYPNGLSKGEEPSHPLEACLLVEPEEGASRATPASSHHLHPRAHCLPVCPAETTHTHMQVLLLERFKIDSCIYFFIR